MRLLRYVSLQVHDACAKEVLGFHGISASANSGNYPSCHIICLEPPAI